LAFDFSFCLFIEGIYMLRSALTKCAFYGVVLTLAACGSSVKLSDVPVEDRTGASAGAGAAGASGAGAGANAGGAAGRTVAPVALPPTETSAQGPSNVARVIYFDYDSFVIKPEYQSVLDGHAKFLNANKSRRVTLEGHTDESGGREYNLALGQKRAEAVRRSLGLLGVSESQVEPVSFGEEKPAVTGSSDADLAKNRRAEIVYR
jgi:peptidoglycan-associated lipoprotein